MYKGFIIDCKTSLDIMNCFVEENYPVVVFSLENIFIGFPLCHHVMRLLLYDLMIANYTLLIVKT